MITPNLSEITKSNALLWACTFTACALAVAATGLFLLRDVGTIEGVVLGLTHLLVAATIAIGGWSSYKATKTLVDYVDTMFGTKEGGKQ